MIDVRRADDAQRRGLRQSRILLSECASCGLVTQPPRSMCPRCHALSWRQVDSSGLGRVYSFIVPRHGVSPGHAQIVAVVELDEGVRIVGGLTGTDLSQVRAGLRVRVGFIAAPGDDQADDGPQLCFRPAEPEPGPSPQTEAPADAADPAPGPVARRVRPGPRPRPSWAGAAVAGIGQTEFSKDSGRPVESLAAEACLMAIGDAGLRPEDVDGMVTFAQDQTDEIVLQQNLGIPLVRWISRAIGGGMASVPVMQLAATAVLTGAASNVLVYRAMNERSETRYGAAGAIEGPPQPHRLLATPAASYALWFQRYLSVYGLTNEDLGMYAVTVRDYASTNPAARFYQRPISLADHQSSRWIVEPVLRLLDCCMESDGATAMVITSAERAKDGPNVPVGFAALTQAWSRNGGGGMAAYETADLSGWADCRLSGREAFGQAGLRHEDIDALMIYDSFSPMPLVVLEELGFCGRGEAADFLRAGHIGRGGSIPVNTHGGHFGEAYIHGTNHNLEAVRQLRGTAVNQVAAARHVMVANGNATAIMSRLD